MRVNVVLHIILDRYLRVFVRQDNNETLALLDGKLPVKEPIDMEDLNQYAAIFDMDGLSWSDRSAQC